MLVCAELLHTLTDEAGMVTVFLYALAKSVVGRALKVRGISKCLPLYFPVIIRIVSFLGG